MNTYFRCHVYRKSYVQLKFNEPDNHNNCRKKLIEVRMAKAPKGVSHKDSGPQRLSREETFTEIERIIAKVKYFLHFRRDLFPNPKDQEDDLEVVIEQLRQRMEGANKASESIVKALYVYYKRLYSQMRNKYKHLNTTSKDRYLAKWAMETVMFLRVVRNWTEWHEKGTSRPFPEPHEHPNSCYAVEKLYKV